MCYGRIVLKSILVFVVGFVGYGVFFLLVIFCILFGDGFVFVCFLLLELENGGYICYFWFCRDFLIVGSVIEYLCVEGYMLKGDYKYLMCKNGEWKLVMEISCCFNEDKDIYILFGVFMLFIVVFIVSFVVFIFFFVVLFVLL